MNQKPNQIVITDLKTCYQTRLLISPAVGGIRARQDARKGLNRKRLQAFLCCTKSNCTQKTN